MLVGLDLSPANPLLMRSGSAGPAGPDPLAVFAPTTGDEDREVFVTFEAPVDAGDGAVKGDGLGTVTGIQIKVGDGPWVTQGAVLAGSVSVYTQLPGMEVAIRARALGYGGRPGRVTTATVVSGGEALGEAELWDAISDLPLWDLSVNRPLFVWV